MHNEKFAAKWLLATKSDYYLKIVAVVEIEKILGL